ncbi:MAG TPA: hypothetical protein VGH37_12120 [Candidatus Acidoferrum sp.]|jgi:hypothetical protein
MQSSVFGAKATRLGVCLTLATLLLLFGVLPVLAQKNADPGTPSPKNKAQAVTIPAGTILPVVLRTAFSFDNCKPGLTLRGKIAQDVSLPNGARIKKGSMIEGRVVDVTPGSPSDGAKVSIRFDKLYLEGQWVPLITNLRAIAGFTAVLNAYTPYEAPSEGTPFSWLPTTQIGGDTVYGAAGPVMSAEDASEVVGKSVGAGGVLARVKAKEGTKCRGAINGNDSPQSLWVFSADACGAYGIEHLTIVHAGRTQPEGTIVLASEMRNFKLRNGDGMLLRVN